MQLSLPYIESTPDFYDLKLMALYTKAFENYYLVVRPCMDPIIRNRVEASSFITSYAGIYPPPASSCACDGKQGTGGPGLHDRRTTPW
jgi:hypothetical protein